MNSLSGEPFLFCFLSIVAAAESLAWNDGSLYEASAIGGSKQASSENIGTPSDSVSFVLVGAGLHSGAQNADRESVKNAPTERLVSALSHCGDTYSVSTNDGRINKIREANMRFQTDSSDLGPRPGKPILVERFRDRDVLVIFATPTEISTFIDESCPLKGDDSPF